MKKTILSVLTLTSLVLLTALSGSSLASANKELTAAQQKMLKQNWQTIQKKIKGPYSVNYCVCTDGTKKPVQAKDGSIANRCKNTNFCGAFRAPCGEALTATGMYVGNIFSSDLFAWNKIPDHHNLLRGYILENYYMTSHPESKLAEMQTYGGLKGVEYEARDMPIFQEKYLADPTYNDYRHYILAYELQRRFFTRNDQGNIQKIRNLAITIQHKIKGPYSLNYCVCTDGTRKPVQAKDGSISNRCKSTNFCGAFRAPAGEALTVTGMYVGNIFSSDLFDWDKIPDHHNLVRGYILENYYMTSHPESKLAEMQT
ncbi:MAG: hypothetical protein GQ559_07620, partial [Desulfobulbaceae bacterium]|nr:hypothetical protein [Desulfobulbaceae bacterium]